MKRDRIRERLVEQINANPKISKDLKSIALDLYDNYSGSEIYDEVSLVSASNENKLFGQISFDCDIEYDDSFSHRSNFNIPGCGIEVVSFSINEKFQMAVHKNVTIGDNTNRAVNIYAHHDYIAPSVNNVAISVETFENVRSAEDVIDVIDEVCTRSLREQIESIKDVDKIENGERFETMLKVLSTVESGKQVESSLFKTM